MSRRASLPGASELFRITTSTTSPALDLPPVERHEKPEPPKSTGNGHSQQLNRAAAQGSGRTKHDAKITVYVSGEELLAMEQARLNLRGKHNLVLDRGRLVREAVAVLLADFDEHGEESVLVKRLRAGGTED
ncbi:hypothetical protein SAMN05421504_10118 [Amycolatopsis xylanica]|uniref:Cobyrinic acid a,c-diamide synthase n=1 Tax=Amycolatopsis xylanica TaxID=589385 RepID=A0A1H2RU83_9PSEU|nr:cobyrinic acid a,c-diamide synthase [Amycolatopsis xylanica]SDW22740.1 hypothetical protein SAMN05421504_10118 [Amycolatopsis xylanica]